MSVGLTRGSSILDYMLSACLSFMEKKGKLITPWRMSRMVPFLCRKSNPIFGLVRLVINRKRFQNKTSPTSDWSSTVALGVAKYPLATIIWKSGGCSWPKNVCGASIRCFVNQLLIWCLSMHLHQWGHQWFILRKWLGRGASSFCFSTGSLSIVVGISIFCLRLIGVVGGILCLWSTFDTLWSKVVVWKSLLLKC